jgi:hypothetical protein
MARDGDGDGVEACLYAWSQLLLLDGGGSRTREQETDLDEAGTRDAGKVDNVVQSPRGCWFNAPVCVRVFLGWRPVGWGEGVRG